LNHIGGGQKEKVYFIGGKTYPVRGYSRFKRGADQTSEEGCLRGTGDDRFATVLIASKRAGKRSVDKKKAAKGHVGVHPEGRQREGPVLREGPSAQQPKTVDKRCSVPSEWVTPAVQAPPRRVEGPGKKCPEGTSTKRSRPSLRLRGLPGEDFNRGRGGNVRTYARRLDKGQHLGKTPLQVLRKTFITYQRSKGGRESLTRRSQLGTRGGWSSPQDEAVRWRKWRRKGRGTSKKRGHPIGK